MAGKDENRDSQEEQPQKPKSRVPKLAFKLINEEDYNKMKTDRQKQEERERNLTVLMRLRPELFNIEDQVTHDKISFNLKLTAVPAMCGFLSTSGYRVFQIKNNEKSMMKGMAVIVLSYLPAYVYYSYRRYEESLFIKDISAKYESRLDDDKLTSFIKS